LRLAPSSLTAPRRWRPGRGFFFCTPQWVLVRGIPLFQIALPFFFFPCLLLSPPIFFFSLVELRRRSKSSLCPLCHISGLSLVSLYGKTCFFPPESQIVPVGLCPFFCAYVFRFSFFCFRRSFRSAVLALPFRISARPSARPLCGPTPSFDFSFIFKSVDVVPCGPVGVLVKTPIGWRPLLGYRT